MQTNGKGKDCIFCNPKLSEDSRFPVLFESENFKIKMGKGALVEGYLMLFPKREVNSFAELNQTEMAEFQKILPNVYKIFNDTYGQVPIIWENGSAYENAGGIFANSIDHAHLHILPIQPSGQMINKIHTDRNLEPVDITNHSEFEKYRDSYYLLFGDPKGEIFLSKTKDPERQYMRRIIAEMIQTPRAWNWREFANDENVQLGVKHLSEAFARLQKSYNNTAINSTDRLV